MGFARLLVFPFYHKICFDIGILEVDFEYMLKRFAANRSAGLLP
jgi:hypothetical protein